MPVRGIGVVTEKNAKPYRTHTVARYRDTHMLYLPIVGMLVSRPTLYLPSNNQQLVRMLYRKIASNTEVFIKYLPT